MSPVSGRKSTYRSVQICGASSDIVPEALIDEVVKEVESDGIDEWAGTPQHEQYDDEHARISSPFDSFTEQPTELYGSLQDHEERERVRRALQELLEAIDAQKPAGIGHNNPPEDIAEDLEVEEIRSGAIELQFEFKQLAPSIAVVKRIGSALYRAAGISLNWVGGKLDRVVDKAIDALAPIAAGGVIAYHDQIASVLWSIFEWLKIVAHTIS